MPFKIKDSLQVGTVVDITSSGIVTNAAFSIADGTNGFLKKTGVNTWSVDTNTYLTTAVTSVALSLPSEITVSGSPITTTGTLSGSWASQTQKTFFSAPNATNGTPSFRTIVASDIPTLNQSTTGSAGSVANSLTINSSGSGASSPATFNGSAAVTISYNTVGAAPLSHTHGNITNAGAIGSTSGLLVETTTSGVLTTKTAGTTSQFLRGDNSWNTAVTSVGGTGTVSGLSLSGTVTSTGNLTLGGTLSVAASDFASQTAKYALIAPVGSAGTPTFRQITWADLTSTPTTISGYGITDAYTKTEVDGLVTGLDFKQSVRVATTANITLSGTQTIDGVSVVAGNRVLVKDQSTASQNGIYVVAAGAWSRSTDADNSPAGEVTAGMYCFVEEGTVNADSGWVLTTNDAITLGSTSLAFAQFNGLGQITAGTGLTKTGNTLNHSNSVTGATIAEGGANRTLAYSGVFNVPSVTYDNQGHVTSTTSVALTLPAGAALGYTTAASTGTVTCTTGTNATLPAATTSLAGLLTGADKTKLDGIAAGAQVNVATNIGVGTVTSTTYPLTSSTGTGHTLAAATGTYAGLMVAADKTKLDASTASATNSTIVLRDGSGNFAANIITVESVNLDATIQKTYATATVATVAETVVDSWAGATYRTCKYLVQIAQGTNYQSSEILVVHNGTTTSMTEYAVIETNGSLATFTSDYSGGNARLKVTMGSATSAAFKIDKTLIVV